jgi:hypothetical protein
LREICEQSNAYGPEQHQAREEQVAQRNARSIADVHPAPAPTARLTTRSKQNWIPELRQGRWNDAHDGFRRRAGEAGCGRRGLRAPFQSHRGQSCVFVSLNGRTLLVAPHILYMSSGEAILEAVALEVDGRDLPDPKLAAYSMADLTSLAVTRKPFSPDPRFNSADPHYAGRVLSACAPICRNRSERKHLTSSGGRSFPSSCGLSLMRACPRADMRSIWPDCVSPTARAMRGARGATGHRAMRVSA